MAIERKYRNEQNMYDECRRLMNYHVVFTTRDGNTFDGIIESVDRDNVVILVGEDVMDEEIEDQNNQQQLNNQYQQNNQQQLNNQYQQNQQQQNNQYQQYNQQQLNNRQRRRYRRFRRRAFPIRSLIALSLLSYPFFAPPFAF